MIQVEPATLTALAKGDARGTIAVRPKALWTCQGATIDISRYVLKFPALTYRIGALLSGSQTSDLILSLNNSTRFFSPLAAEGFLGNKRGEHYFGSELAFSMEVQRADDTWEAIPIFTGYVQALDLQVGTCDMTVSGFDSVARSVEIPEEIELGVGPIAENAAGMIRELITTYTTLDASRFGTRFAAAEDLYFALDWAIGGTIEKGARIGQAVDALAASGAATLWTTQDGKIELEHELPSIAGETSFSRARWPGTIDEHVADDWTYAQGTDLFATEISVAFQGFSVSYRDTSLEAEVGRITKTVPCPYVRFSRTARLIAFLLHTQVENWQRVVGFTMGPLGTLIELNDRIQVEDPITGESRLYRVVTKNWRHEGVRIEAASQGHQNGIIDGTFAQMGVTDWTSSTERML